MTGVAIKTVSVLTCCVLCFTLAGCKATPKAVLKEKSPTNSSSFSVSSSSVSSSSTADSQVAASSVQTPAQQQAAALYPKFEIPYLNGNYDQAIQVCDQALALDPNDYDAYNIKGIALCFKKDYTEGMSLIEKSLNIKPDYFYGMFNKAMGYKLQHDYDNALIWFNKGLELKPDDAWSYYGIATIYADRSQTSSALEYLQIAINFNSSVKATAIEQGFHWENFHNNAQWKAMVGA